MRERKGVVLIDSPAFFFQNEKRSERALRSVALHRTHDGQETGRSAQPTPHTSASLALLYTLVWCAINVRTKGQAIGSRSL
jgi:hypothetical protein